MKESGENYLETIYMLYKSKGEIKSIDIANKLGVSRPSVNRACNILKEKGFITQERYGDILLTDAGLQKAQEIIAKHYAITRFLVMTLGLDTVEAETNACRIEHIISDVAMEKIVEYIENNKKD